MREETEDESEALLSGLKVKETNNLIISPTYNAVCVWRQLEVLVQHTGSFTDQEWVVSCLVEQHPSSAAHRERCEKTVTRTRIGSSEPDSLGLCIRCIESYALGGCLPVYRIRYKVRAPRRSGTELPLHS